MTGHPGAHARIIRLTSPFDSKWCAYTGSPGAWGAMGVAVRWWLAVY